MLHPAGPPNAIPRSPLKPPSNAARFSRNAGVLFLFLCACAPVGASRALAQDGSILPDSIDVDVKGYLEGRAVATGKTRSWEDSSLGKLRFGSSTNGGRRALTHREAAAVEHIMFGFDWTAVVHVSANEEQHLPIDIVQSHLQYNPAPRGRVVLRAKAGVFSPPVSVENTGLARPGARLFKQAPSEEPFNEIDNRVDYYSHFSAAYALVSKDFGRHRISLRLDRFGTNDRDVSLDDNNEHGTAVTAAYVLRPAPRQRLTLEALYVKSHRPERSHLGLPVRTGEALF